MKSYKFIFYAFLCLHFSCKSQSKKINGLSFVAAADAVQESNIKPVVKVHANYVALMPFGFIKELSSPKIIHNTDRQWFGETEKGVLQYAKEFQKKDISIMIKPHIWVWNGAFTGFIEMKSEETWQELENSYTEFILTYAKTAEKLDAAIFCIGTELEKFVAKRPKFWKELIVKIRAIYKGKLTYAANWDEFKRVHFWKELDYVGIDAYFPLSDKKLPTLQDFENGWKLHKHEIYRVQKEVNIPVLFTEFGYRSIDFSGKKPWDSTRNPGRLNLQTQADGLQAIHNQFWKEEWFAGGFIWKWFLKHNQVGGEKNNRFTPQNKPAEKLLSTLYAN